MHILNQSSHSYMFFFEFGLCPTQNASFGCAIQFRDSCIIPKQKKVEQNFSGKGNLGRMEALLSPVVMVT
jgi:hypothetical protein